MCEKEKYLVCTICSAIKYEDKIAEVSCKLEHVGVIVLKPDVCSSCQNINPNGNVPSDMLIKLHNQKTDMSDFIVVIDDTIGESVNNEIEYANSRGLIILYWSSISEKIDALLSENKLLTKDDVLQYELDYIKESYLSRKRDPNKQPLCTIVHDDDPSIGEMVFKIKEALTFSGAVFFELFPRKTEEYSDAHTISSTRTRFYESICARLMLSDYIIIVSEDNSDFVKMVQAIYKKLDPNAKIFECNNDITLDAIHYCAKCGMILTYDLLKCAMSDPRQDSELFSAPSGYYTTKAADIVAEANGEKKILSTIEVTSNPETSTEDHDDCCGE